MDLGDGWHIYIIGIVILTYISPAGGILNPPTYHRRIRGCQLHVGGEEMGVQRSSVSTYRIGSGVAFVKGFSAFRDVRCGVVSSSPGVRVLDRPCSQTTSSARTSISIRATTDMDQLLTTRQRN